MNESLIWGNRAKVTFKPLLFVNGRESSVENIKNGNITVKIEKTELDIKIPIEYNFEDIVFNEDNKEYEFEVIIPEMISSLKFEFNCEITNSKGEKVDLYYNQDSKLQKSKDKIYKGFFRKCGKNYFYENIGRNGENNIFIEGKEKEIELYTN